MDNNSNNQPLPEPMPGQQPTPPIPNQVPPQPMATPEPPVPTQTPPQPMATPEPVAPNQPYPQPIATSQYNPPVQGTKSVSIKNILIIVAAALGAICFFLPWISVKSSFLGISATATGAEITHNAKYLGYTMLILFIATIIVSSVNILKELNSTSKISVSVMGGLAALSAIIFIIIVLNDLQGYGSISFGLYLAIIMGIATAVLPWIPIKGQ